MSSAELDARRLGNALRTAQATVQKLSPEIVESCATDDISDMTDERIQKIKSAVEAADHISPEKKTELLAVLTKLKPAIAEVAQTHEEEAERISRFVETSAHQVARKNESSDSVENGLHGLRQTVEKFEASHPKLTAFVTEYSAVLSGLGI
jgi:seryl-tRNA synthetase